MSTSVTSILSKLKDKGPVPAQAPRSPLQSPEEGAEDDDEQLKRLLGLSGDEEGDGAAQSEVSSAREKIQPQASMPSPKKGLPQQQRKKPLAFR